MVEKIIINPNKVRGYGNIMSPHSSSDYEVYMSSISSGTDTVNGVETTVYTMTDTTLFTDKGTSTNYSTAWTNSNSNVTVNRSTTETTLTRTASTNGFYELQNVITSTSTIEADLWINDTGENISLRNGSTVLDWLTLSEYNLSASTWHHWKIVCDGTSLTIIVDGDLKETKTVSANVNRFTFRLNSSTLQIKYKNFIVYE